MFMLLSESVSLLYLWKKARNHYYVHSFLSKEIELHSSLLKTSHHCDHTSHTLERRDKNTSEDVPIRGCTYLHKSVGAMSKKVQKESTLALRESPFCEDVNPNTRSQFMRTHIHCCVTFWTSHFPHRQYMVATTITSFV